MLPLLPLLLGLGCDGPAAPAVADEPTPAPEVALVEPEGPPMPFDKPAPVTTVDAPGLSESSGLAPSQRFPGSWWTINDSGNAAALYRFDLEGTFLGVHPIPGLMNRDWEALAAGPCPGGDDPCVFIAEIGDNKTQYEHVAVHAVREPAVDASAVAPLEHVASWRARYPEGARNAEALLRDPVTGRLYLATKHGSGLTEIYRFPAAPSDTVGPLERIASRVLEGDTDSMRKVTGGAFDAAGRKLVLRTYMVAWEWDVHADDRHAHWSEPPRRAWLAAEKQGEGVSYLPDGALLTTSEGVPMAVNTVPRTSGP